jgi:hypothetical protein
MQKKTFFLNEPMYLTIYCDLDIYVIHNYIDEKSRELFIKTIIKYLLISINSHLFLVSHLQHNSEVDTVGLIKYTTSQLAQGNIIKSTAFPAEVSSPLFRGRDSTKLTIKFDNILSASE